MKERADALFRHHAMAGDVARNSVGKGGAMGVFACSPPSARTWLCGVFLIFGMILAGQARAVDLVVLHAEGVILNPGQKIDGSKPLTLKPGEKATLIAPNGKIHKFQGPYNQPPLADDTGVQNGVIDSLKELLKPTKAQSEALGVTRDATSVLDAATRSGWVPEPWLIDASRGGHHCVRQGQPVVFWRPGGERAQGLRLRIGADLWKARTKWPAGADRLATPAAMPVLDSVEYRIALDGREATSTLHVVPSTVDALGALAAWLHAKGCDAQAMALLRPVEG